MSSESPFASKLWDELPDALLVVNGAEIVDANRAANLLFGYDRGALRSISIDDLVAPWARDEHRSWRESFLRQHPSGPVYAGRLFPAVTANGTPLMVRLGLVPLDPHGGLAMLIARQGRQGPDLDEDPPLANGERERLVQDLYATGLLLRLAERDRGDRDVALLAEAIDTLDGLMAMLVAGQVDRIMGDRSGD